MDWFLSDFNVSTHQTCEAKRCYRDFWRCQGTWCSNRHANQTMIELCFCPRPVAMLPLIWFACPHIDCTWKLKLQTHRSTTRLFCGTFLVRYNVDSHSFRLLLSKLWNPMLGLPVREYAAVMDLQQRIRLGPHSEITIGVYRISDGKFRNCADVGPPQVFEVHDLSVLASLSWALSSAIDGPPIVL